MLHRNMILLNWWNTLWYPLCYKSRVLNWFWCLYDGDERWKALLDRQTHTEYFSEYYTKMSLLLGSCSMIVDILGSATMSCLEGIKLYRSSVEFVIGCMFMTKAAHEGTLMWNRLNLVAPLLDGLNWNLSKRPQGPQRVPISFSCCLLFSSHCLV